MLHRYRTCRLVAISARARPKGKCFTGSDGADDCLNNGRTVRYPIQYAWQNVGSFTVPYAFESVPNDYAVTGIPARLGSSFTQPWAREHFWKTANADFRGWRGYDGATPYGKTLRDIAHFFTDPTYTPPSPPPCPGPASITPGATTTASLLLTCPL